MHCVIPMQKKNHSNKNTLFMLFVWIVHLKPCFCIMFCSVIRGLIIRLNVKMTILLQTKTSLQCVYSPVVTTKHIAQRALMQCTLCTFKRAIPVIKCSLYSFMHVPSDSHCQGTIYNWTLQKLPYMPRSLQWKEICSPITMQQQLNVDFCEAPQWI